MERHEIGIFVQDRLFTLQGNSSTYQMKVDGYGYLLHCYYGRKACGDMSFLMLAKDRAFSPNPYDAGDDTSYSLDSLPQEFPVSGNGDFRSSCFDVVYEDSSWGLDLRYKEHRVLDGLAAIPGLPAVYSDDAVRDGAQTLQLVLEDAAAGLEVTLSYGLLPRLDVITRTVSVTNVGTKTVTIKKLQSACIDFVAGDYDLLKFYGRHAMERNLERSAIGHAAQLVESRRGASSHQYNPFVICARHDATEDAGSAWGMAFMFSGDFKAQAEKGQFNATRIQMGLQDEHFAYPVKPGESFHAPQVIMSYSSRGLSKLSQNFHACISRHVCRGPYRDAVRPLLINSWEASYFAISRDSILSLARQAKELGMEMLVMDDGWFGKRDNDLSGLGDWQVNERKLGCSLKELVQAVNDIGLQFGIWFEPEMVSEDSDLYRSHGDYAFAFPGRRPVRGRHQLLLDFSRPEVVDSVFRQMCAVLDSANIAYVKWDFNRSINDVYSAHAQNQGAVLYDFVKGSYSLAQKLLDRYPKLLIEGCSGGGGRFDAGMLYYTPQIWCSDNTDAVDRTLIQYGTSFCYPVSTVGSHVSIVPNHQTGRSCPLRTRGIVAMSGSFGYELDLSRLDGEEREEIRRQVGDFHRFAPLVRQGEYYRLSNPFTDGLAAWAHVSQDKGEALVCAVLLEMHGNMTDVYVGVKGLAEGCLYRDEETGRLYPSDALAELGLPLEGPLGQYRSFRWHLVKCEA